MVCIYYSEKVQWNDHVIHPIPEYKISTQVIMSTNIISKYKIKKWSRNRVLWWRWWLCGCLVSGLGWDIGWSLTRCLSRAWGLGFLWWIVVYWWLWRWISWWSSCQVSALRRAKGHLTLRRWYGQGLRGLRWIPRSGGAWPSLVRCWQVCMAPSDARHNWYGRDTKVSSSSWWSWGVEWRGNGFTRWRWAFCSRGWVVWKKQRLWRPLNRNFKWLLVSFLIVGSSHKWSLAFRMGFAKQITSSYCENFRSWIFSGVKFLQLELLVRNFRSWNWVVQNFRIWNWLAGVKFSHLTFCPTKCSVLEFPCFLSSKIKLSHNKIKLKREISI